MMTALKVLILIYLALSAIFDMVKGGAETSELQIIRGIVGAGAFVGVLYL